MIHGMHSISAAVFRHIADKLQGIATLIFLHITALKDRFLKASLSHSFVHKFDMAITLKAAAIVAIIIESILYGQYLHCVHHVHH
jgi:hypothetical protein